MVTGPLYVPSVALTVTTCTDPSDPVYNMSDRPLTGDQIAFFEDDDISSLKILVVVSIRVTFGE